MVRTQVSLSREDYARAKKEAKRLGISLAELFRRSLRMAVEPDPSRPWMSYRGLVTSGDPNSNNNIDALIYGQKD
jgi:hypothetical protein